MFLRVFVPLSVVLHVALVWWLDARAPTVVEPAPAGDEAIAVSLVAAPAPPAPQPATEPPPTPPAPEPPPPEPEPEPLERLPEPEPALPPPEPVPEAAATVADLPEPSATETVVASAAAVPEVPPTVAPSPVDPHERDRLLREIRDRIQGALRYPRIARRRGWEGTARVQFRVGPDGRATNVVLAGPTGRVPLDEEAIAVLDRAGAFPSLDGTLEVPVRFALSD